MSKINRAIYYGDGKIDNMKPGTFKVGDEVFNKSAVQQAIAEATAAKDAEINELKEDAEMYALKDQDNYRLRSHLAVAVEALERVVLYQAHNGDDWPARQAKEALATIKGDSNEQD